MGYKLIRQEDFNTYTIKHFQCDADSDRATIISDYSSVTGKNALHAGWTATVTANSSTVSYILDNDLSSWTEIAFSKGGDPGSGYYPLIASTESVMTTNGSGNPATIPYSTEDDANTMMRRDAEGKAQVATPISTDDKKTIVNKEYADKIASDFEDGTRVAEEAIHSQFADIANQINTDREIDDAEEACPPIVFGTVGGKAEVQSGYNRFEELRGNTIKWNQLVQNGKFASTDNWNTSNALLSVTSNTASFQGTSENARLYTSVDLVNGHKYLRACLVKLSAVPSGNVWVRTQTSSASTYDDQQVNKNETGWQFMTSVFQASETFTSVNGFAIRDNSTSDWVEIQVKNVQLFDLTDIYGAGNEPSTVAEFVRDFPMPYYAYNAGTLLSSKSATLLSIGRNQWDEEVQSGYFSPTDGEKIESAQHICSKNFIPVLAKEKYCAIGSVSYVLFYDIEGKFISATNVENNSVFETPINCVLLMFDIPSSYGTTYKHDICIYINWDTPNLPYVSYQQQRVELPNNELRSAGAAYDVAYQEGGGKRRLKEVVIDGTNITAGYKYTPTSDNNIYQLNIADAKATPDNNTVANAIASSFDVGNWNDLRYSSGTGTVKAIVVNSSATVCLAMGNSNGFDTAAKVNTWLQTNPITLVYELAEETDITLEENPGWDEYLLVDNFGTLEFTADPAQTPQVPQAYFVRYTVNLVEFLDSAYVRADGDVENIVVQNDLSGYVQKQTGTTTYPQAYVKNADGTQGMAIVTSSRVSDSIVQRTSTGAQITVPDTPTETYHATSKKYVDGKLTATLTQLSDGTYSLTFGV